MNQDPNPHERHDFDWAKACRQFSLEREFSALREAVKQTVKVVQDDPPTGAFPQAFKFEEYGPDERMMFSVLQYVMGNAFRGVHFTLVSGGIIADSSSTSGVETSRKLTVYMTEAGEFRYQIDGKGSYLRWQVVRGVLGEMLGLA